MLCMHNFFINVVMIQILSSYHHSTSYSGGLCNSIFMGQEVDCRNIMNIKYVSNTSRSVNSCDMALDSISWETKIYLSFCISNFLLENDNVGSLFD